MSYEISYTRVDGTITVRMIEDRPNRWLDRRGPCTLSETEKQALRRWLGPGCAHPYLSDLPESPARSGIITRCEDCDRRVLILAESGKRYLVEPRPTQ